MTVPGASAVRVARENDASALADLAARTFALACPPGTAVADMDEFIAANLTESHFAAYVHDPDARIWVAESPACDGKAAGYSLIHRSHPTQDIVLATRNGTAVDLSSSTGRIPILLSKFYVDPAFHGGDVAAELMNAVLTWAAGTDAPAIWLGVNNQNRRAIRFYAKSGFAVVGTRVFAVGGELHNDLVMARPVSY